MITIVNINFHDFSFFFTYLAIELTRQRDQKWPKTTNRAIFAQNRQFFGARGGTKHFKSCPELVRVGDPI
jgi:hypothetical protein